MVKSFQTWDYLLDFLEKTFGIEKDLMSVLFLIGLQESGRGFKSYSRDEKTELIKLAQFIILSREKFFIKISASNADHVWAENPAKPLPSDPILEKLLKSLILDYFNEKPISN